jgi:hypothetical protein
MIHLSTCILCQCIRDHIQGSLFRSRGFWRIFKAIGDKTNKEVIEILY